MISNSGSAWYLFHGSAKGFFSLDIPLELGWWFSWWFMGWSNGWFKRQQLLQQKPHGTHLLLLLLHRILRSTTDLARDGVNLPAEDPGLPAIDVNIGLPQKRVQFHFECFVFRPQKNSQFGACQNHHCFNQRNQPLLWWRLAFPPLCFAERWQLTALRVPIVTVLDSWGCI